MPQSQRQSRRQSKNFDETQRLRSGEVKKINR